MGYRTVRRQRRSKLLRVSRDCVSEACGVQLSYHAIMTVRRGRECVEASRIYRTGCVTRDDMRRLRLILTLA